ncbi:YbfB/YjiJ family MFS transporter [uncultured Desulfuromusa sp.]|uniref:YbfB/YjiJ family MFS transporter n=1 Tax=uncultured Desulfuromusa sp. TaxID=219183 RepID=UPI003748934D
MSTMQTNFTPHRQRARRDWDALCILLEGILGMIIAMGIGRFSFTPILPLMQRDLGISNSIAGWLAGFNYLGYLAGAVLCFIVPRLMRTRYVTISSLFLSIATTVTMGLTLSVFFWGILRLISGIVSAILFITISAEVGEALSRRGYSHWLGSLYGGVGAGIALSGFTIPWLDRIGQWDGAWIGMGVLAAILVIFGSTITTRKTADFKFTPEQKHQSQSLRILWPLIVAYFFEGLGYIVTATFIVAIVAMTPGLEDYAAYVWVVVGIAAVPSTVVWPLLSRRIGNKNCLLAAYALQFSGILVSMYADTVIEITFTAITFGGTFLGIVALTLAEGSFRMKHDGRKSAAILTASFGVGQILGPILAGFLADLQESFALPLILASTCIMIGWIFTLIDRNFISQ